MRSANDKFVCQISRIHNLHGDSTITITNIWVDDSSIETDRGSISEATQKQGRESTRKTNTERREIAAGGAKEEEKKGNVTEREQLEFYVMEALSRVTVRSQFNLRLSTT